MKNIFAILKKYKAAANIFLIAGAGVFFFASPAFSQIEGFGLGVRQGIYDIELFPLVDHEEVVGIKNSIKNLHLPVRVEAVNWNLAKDSEDIVYVLEEESLNAAKWFSFETEEGRYLPLTSANFILPPDGFKDLKLRLRAPLGAEKGTYLVALRIQAVAPDFYFENEGPRFLPEINVLFFIKVRDALNDAKPQISVQVKDFYPVKGKEKGKLFFSEPKKFFALVENSGVYHFKTTGSIEVRNVFGMLKNSLPLQERFLIPGRERSLEFNSLYKGFFSRMHFGFYQAKMVVFDQQGGQALTSKSVGFWVFSWQVLIFLAGSLIAFFFGVKKRLALTRFLKELFKKKEL